MRIDWDTPIDLLMHSGDIRYIDLDEGELCHWKYIKREKLSNGKYRYYYDYGQKQLEEYNRVKRDYDNVAWEYEQADNEFMRVQLSDADIKKSLKLVVKLYALNKHMSLPRKNTIKPISN